MFTSSYLAPEILKGRVEQLTERSYFALPLENGFEKGEAIPYSERKSYQCTPDLLLRFSPEGILRSSSYMDVTGKPVSTWETECSDKQIIGARLTEKGNTVLWVHLQYSDEGVLEKMVQNDGIDSALSLTVEWGYDRNGRLCRLDNYNPEGIAVAHFLLEYNEAGKVMIIQQKDEAGQTQQEMLYAYDDAGRKLSEFVKNTDDEVQVTEYSYLAVDRKGNWVSAVARKNGTDIFIERELSYY